MKNELAALSNQLAETVDHTGKSVVAVHGGHRFPATGVHWKPGVIVTPDHTLQREEQIRLTLPDGSEAIAELAGRDPGTDLAVLKAPGLPLPVTAAASGGIRAGGVVLAVGRSPERGVTAAMGVISIAGGRWTTWRGGSMDAFLRLDIALYPGSSGAAVVDVEGHVVGIATSGLSRSAPMAIPAATIERVAIELLIKGHISRGYLGVGLNPVALPEHLRKKVRVESKSALMVVNVEPDSPAWHAGVLLGDILVAIENSPVGNTERVQSFLGAENVGKTLTLSILRAGEPAELALTVRERGTAKED